VLTYPLFRISLLGSILAFSGTLQAQTGLIEEQSTGLSTIEASGFSSSSSITLRSGADIRFGVKTPSYTIGEGHDILFGRSLGLDGAKLHVAFKSSAMLPDAQLINFPGTLGRQYQILLSTNLIFWIQHSVHLGTRNEIEVPTRTDDPASFYCIQVGLK